MRRNEKGQGIESCEVCGKELGDSFEVHLGGRRHVFDSFECAMRGLMPRCSICGGIVLNTGLRIEDRLYCGEACAGSSSLQEYEVPLFRSEPPKV